MFEFRASDEWIGWGCGNDGTVWRFHKKHGYILYRGHKDKNGYIMVSRRPDGCKGRKESVMAHRLIMSCFHNIKLRDRALVIDHLDNNRSNNKLDNLKATSQGDNIRRAGLQGRIPGNRRLYVHVPVITLAQHLINMERH